MRVCYLLDRPELSGGVKVVFQHAQLLHSLGYQATVLGKGERPGWIRFKGKYLNYERRPPKLTTQDLLIATYWTTIELARKLHLGPLVHFCQGYEGHLAHLLPLRSRIEEAYRLDLPTFVVAPHLERLIRERFARTHFRLVPPPVDPLFRQQSRWFHHRVPRILIMGVFEAEVKGIVTALEAVRELRQMGQRCKVIRISPLPLSSEEARILRPDRYLRAVKPKVVARLMRGCDLLISASLAMEGFGLPLLEAGASGLPAVASRIPATEFIGEQYLTLVPAGDSHAFALAAHRLLNNRTLWEEARQRGLSAAQKFNQQLIANRLRESVDWAFYQDRAQQP